jgi:hypothetical protein
MNIVDLFTLCPDIFNIILELLKNSDKFMLKDVCKIFSEIKLSKDFISSIDSALNAMTYKNYDMFDYAISLGYKINNCTIYSATNCNIIFFNRIWNSVYDKNSINIYKLYRYTIKADNLAVLKYIIKTNLTIDITLLIKLMIKFNRIRMIRWLVKKYKPQLLKEQKTIIHLIIVYGNVSIINEFVEIFYKSHQKYAYNDYSYPLIKLPVLKYFEEYVEFNVQMLLSAIKNMQYDVIEYLFDKINNRNISNYHQYYIIKCICYCKDDNLKLNLENLLNVMNINYNTVSCKAYGKKCNKIINWLIEKELFCGIYVLYYAFDTNNMDMAKKYINTTKLTELQIYEYSSINLNMMIKLYGIKHINMCIYENLTVRNICNFDYSYIYKSRLRNYDVYPEILVYYSDNKKLCLELLNMWFYKFEKNPDLDNFILNAKTKWQIYWLCDRINIFQIHSLQKIIDKQISGFNTNHTDYDFICKNDIRDYEIQYTYCHDICYYDWYNKKVPFRNCILKNLIKAKNMLIKKILQRVIIGSFIYYGIYYLFQK